MKVATFSAVKSTTIEADTFNLRRGHKQGERIGQFRTSLRQTSPHLLPIVKLFSSIKY